VDISINLPPLDVPGLLKEFKIRPNKKLGQNFLVDPNALKRVVEVASLSASDEILEIGAGVGSLTRLLASHAQRVVAVEVDKDLLPPLHKVLKRCKNVDIIFGDILTFEPTSLIQSEKYLVVANIPYYITSAIIRRLMQASVRPSRMVLTVQTEVAERICAEPGNLSMLSLSVQVYSDPKIAARIPAGSFYPPPQVDSAIVRIELSPDPKIQAIDLPVFFLLAKTAFAQKRKKLRNSLGSFPNLNAGLAETLLEEAAIDPGRRPESLTINEWASLARVYNERNRNL
jgi:16S rRNA (adenine1518-N6/adenine1519-N6)-dimethyltransferase